MNADVNIELDMNLDIIIRRGASWNVTLTPN